MSQHGTVLAAARVVPSVRRGSFRRWITIAILVGLVIRVLYVVWLHHVGNFWIGDSLIYHGEGVQLARGDGWINPVLVDLYGIRSELAMHPPAYSLWLALWSWFGFTSMFAHQLVTIPIGLATIAVVGQLGRRVWSDRVGIAAAFIAAVHPSIWSWEGMVLQEPMAILATALLLLATVRLVRRLDVRSVLLAGLAAGFAPLTRAELVSALAICLLTILVAHRTRTALLATVSVGLLAILLVMPWSIHNSMRFSRFVPLSNGLGVTLASTSCDSLEGQWLGYWSITCGREATNRVAAEWAAEHPDARVIELNDADGVPISPRYYFQYPELDEAEVDARLTDATVEWLKDHPSYLIRSVPARLGRALGVFRPIEQMSYDSNIEMRKRAVVIGAWAGYYALFPFVILGGWTLKRRSRSILVMLLAPVFSALVVIAMTFGNTRYRAIAEPTMAVLGAIGLAVAWGYLRRLWNEHPAEQE